MSNKKDTSYRSMAFSPESPKDKFYTYIDSADLAATCEETMGEITKCRSIGILSSDEGRFYLSPLDQPDYRKEGSVRLTMLYLECPPPTAVIPYPVQIFGDLQWKNRPVLFVRILQVMTAAMAIRLNNIIQEITTLHCATASTSQESNEEL